MSKSCYMHFKPKRQEELGLEMLFCEETLEIKGVPIKLINTTKFLGVVIDDDEYGYLTYKSLDKN